MHVHLIVILHLKARSHIPLPGAQAGNLADHSDEISFSLFAMSLAPNFPSSRHSSDARIQRPKYHPGQYQELESPHEGMVVHEIQLLWKLE
jgi:hypothetical protein